MTAIRELAIGMIGGGMVSDAHLKALSAIQNVNVRWMVDQNQSALDTQAEIYNIPMTSCDYQEVIADKQVDVVYICLPHYLHCQVAIEALQSGKHVICEKPLSMNSREADQMLTAAREANRRLFISEDHRFIPENIKARQIISDGLIGRPFMCMASFIGNEIERLSDAAHWKGTADLAGGGVIIDNGYHVIDTLLSFFGPVHSVQALAKRLVVQEQSKEEDTALVNLSFGHGIEVSLALTFSAKYNQFPSDYGGAGIRYDIYGTEGSLHLINEEEGVVLETITTAGRTALTREAILSDLSDEMPLDIDRHFIDCILNDSAPSVTDQEGREVMRVIDACYESVKAGQTVILNH